MDARAGFYALALSAALVMASGAMLTEEAMAQADDVAVQAEEPIVGTDDVTAGDETVTAQDEAVEQPVAQQQSATVKKPAKSDLDQSAVRATPVVQTPRATRTSTRSSAVPKILGSYR